MGCCGSSDAAGDKKKGGKGKKGEFQPDIVVKGNEEVKFSRQIKKATYGPEDASKGEAVDVTAQVQKLISSGVMVVTDGIQGSLTFTSGEEPFPEVTEASEKVLKAWSISEKPDAEFEDFDTVNLKKQPILYASYGIDDKVKDVTAQMNELVENDKLDHVGGIHTPLKEPLPMDPNSIKIWYA